MSAPEISARQVFPRLAVGALGGCIIAALIVRALALPKSSFGAGCIAGSLVVGGQGLALLAIRRHAQRARGDRA